MSQNNLFGDNLPNENLRDFPKLPNRKCDPIFQVTYAENDVFENPPLKASEVLILIIKTSLAAQYFTLPSHLWNGIIRIYQYLHWRSHLKLKPLTAMHNIYIPANDMKKGLPLFRIQTKAPILMWFRLRFKLENIFRQLLK